MRKQGQRLEHVANPSRLRRERDRPFCIEKRVITQPNRSIVRRLQTRDAIQQRGLSRAGWAEEYGEAGRKFFGYPQLEGRPTLRRQSFANADEEHGRIYRLG